MGAYINNWQASVAEWVELRPIVDIYDKDMGYGGGGRRRDLWRRQTAARKNLNATLYEILVAGREGCW